MTELNDLVFAGGMFVAMTQVVTYLVKGIAVLGPYLKGEKEKLKGYAATRMWFPFPLEFGYFYRDAKRVQKEFGEENIKTIGNVYDHEDFLKKQLKDLSFKI